jgi:hypothetical protein
MFWVLMKVSGDSARRVFVPSVFRAKDMCLHRVFESTQGSTRVRCIIFFVAMTIGMLLSVSSIGRTKDPPWIAKDWTQWSSVDCENILQYSPWAYFADVGGRHYGPSVYTNSEGQSGSFHIQLRSALPIRQAFLRILELTKHYDKMDPQKKQAFDMEHASDVTETDGSPVVVLWWSDDARFPEESRQGALVLSDGSLVMPIKTMMTGDFVKRNPMTHMEEHFSTSAEYTFPRTVNGKPLYTAQDKELVFVQGAVLLYHGKTEELGPQRLQNFRPGHYPSGGPNFPIPTLMYKGKLEY